MAVENKVVGAAEGLAGLQLKPEYRSDSDDLVRDFYVPCLERSTLYRRAVGYFTSHGLSAAAQGLSALVQSDGRMLLVASPLFDADDLEAIRRGYTARDDLVVKALLRHIEATPEAIVRDRLGYLAWLIAEERLEIRIAIPLDERGHPRRGIYHEKMGIFSDQFGNAVAFTGSPNETAGGLVDNFEATDVFWSWNDPHGRVERKAANFDRLWQNKTVGLAVLPFPEAVRNHLLIYRPKDGPTAEPPRCAIRPTVPDWPAGLWEHQVEAIRAWEDNGRRGLVSMATGSGKTLVALVAAQRCPDLCLLVVAVPRGALVEQWAREASEHTDLPNPVLVYESASNWQEPLFNRLRAVRRQHDSRPVFVVGTLHSLSATGFQSVLSDAGVSGNALLIVDEVHNVGAPSFRQTLREEFVWRLGLSATPARYFDEEGTQVIREYFGPTVYIYDLRRALQDGHLCPYRYFVYPAHLSNSEYTEYVELTKRIVQHRGAAVSEELTFQTNNALDNDSEEVKQLLFRRARILKKCKSKIQVLETVLANHSMKRALIYCADNEQLGEVIRLLKGKHILHLVYTAETPSDARRSAVRSLGAGHVSVLAAIDCLDEGVDVPTVDEAIILASSSNKRQFIQRRGRILRRAPGKSLATLIDIVVLPPVSAGRDARRVLNGELARIKEMAELAENKHDALRSVKEHASPYGVTLTELLSGEGDG